MKKINSLKCKVPQLLFNISLNNTSYSSKAIIVSSSSSSFFKPHQKKYSSKFPSFNNSSSFDSLRFYSTNNTVIMSMHNNNTVNNNKKKRQCIGAIDQGTTSTRFMLFDKDDLTEISTYQLNHESYFPKPGWVEQDPMDILRNTIDCMKKACEQYNNNAEEDIEILGIGVTNQRETTILWDSETGLPLCKAIVWNDTRTKDLVDRICKEKAFGDFGKFRQICGLPLSTYFSAVKLKWMIDHYQEVRNAIDRGTCMFGTVDSWIIWNLTGGCKKNNSGGKHVTDVTNASRTMLMNLSTLQWDENMFQVFDVPKGVNFPEIKSSAERYGYIDSDIVDNNPILKGVCISGCIGDQQSATIGQRCFNKGDAKNTYGTGCFVLMNCGEKIVQSNYGLLSTVQYQLGKDAAPVYALEGSVAVAGSGINWLKDNLHFIEKPSDSEVLASKVKDTGGVYFVPAFNGLFSPYWRSDARGAILGITQFTTAAHIVRAMLEAVCFQTHEVLDAMTKDSNVEVTNLMVDGGMIKNKLLMQLQADICQTRVIIPSYSETTVLGAAICSAFGVGIYKDVKDIPLPNKQQIIYNPSITEEETEYKLSKWRKAIEKSLNWVDE
ncbi:hypothetical protein ABK040_003305 [Willaertia magna]